jgi:hypothetical protein
MPVCTCTVYQLRMKHRDVNEYLVHGMHSPSPIRAVAFTYNGTTSVCVCVCVYVVHNFPGAVMLFRVELRHPEKELRVLFEIVVFFTG